jgi:ribosomal protein S6--L-glutamate ligase
MAEPLLIGRREYLDFPEWGVHHVRAKVDTGTFRSTLDVDGYELHAGDDGVAIVRMRLLPHRRHPERVVLVETPVLRTVIVCSTSGTRQQRPLIETLVRLGPIAKRIRLTLANRCGLRYRMLLGREALAGSFIVDVREKYLLR